MKRVVTVCILMFVLTVSSLVAQDAAAQGRFVIILRDTSLSFKFISDAKNQMVAIVKALGPNDYLLIADVGSEFKPEKNVSLECNMPDVQQSILVPPDNLAGWRKAQATLNAKWNDVEKKQQAISYWLSNNPIKPENFTDFYKAIEYCSMRFSRVSQKEKHIYVFSDMENDTKGKKKSDNPPTNQQRFDGVNVTLLFVPWLSQSQWSQKSSAWENWFVNMGKAKSFAMYEPAESKTLKVIEKSTVPKKPRSPFEKQ